MKIGDFEFPDKCPNGCKFIGETTHLGQNSICIRCPVLCCRMPKTEEDKKYLPVIHPDEYRQDWAEEWDRFFKDEVPVPTLCIMRNVKDIRNNMRDTIERVKGNKND